jgi:hypothetical protein
MKDYTRQGKTIRRSSVPFKYEVVRGLSQHGSRQWVEHGGKGDNICLFPEAKA